VNKRSGFTLIELLIVVAIIAILAAIAVPNFLEAQTRAKVSRVRNDLRTLATAMESYCVDNSKYPPHYSSAAFPFPELNQTILTSPIAYITSIPMCPFAMTHPNAWLPFKGKGYRREDITKLATLQSSGMTSGDNGWVGLPAETWAKAQYNSGRKWMFWSLGPDVRHEFYLYMSEYDPTNGTISVGDIIRLGP
jgi:type II secretion system protein G